MPSQTFGPSVRELLLVIVFLLGFCVLLLVEVTNATRGYGTTIGLIGRFVGTVTVLGALLTAFVERKFDLR